METNNNKVIGVFNLLENNNNKFIANKFIVKIIGSILDTNNFIVIIIEQFKNIFLIFLIIAGPGVSNDKEEGIGPDTCRKCDMQIANVAKNVD